MNGDCRLIATSELLKKNNNINVSSAMCFGLSESYDFNFFIEKNTKIPLIVILGNMNNIEKLFENIGINYKTIQTKDNLENIINKNKYVMVDVDRYYLDYLREKFGNTHFGKHAILLWEHDDKYFSCFDALDNSINVIKKEIAKELNVDIKELEGKTQHKEKLFTTSMWFLLARVLFAVIVLVLNLVWISQLNTLLVYFELNDDLKD